MSEQLKEAVSALVDDSATELDVRRVVKDAQDSGEAIETFRRYQLLSSALQQNASVAASSELLSIDLTARIAAKIDAEPFDVADVATATNAVNEQQQYSDGSGMVSAQAAVAALSAGEDARSGWFKQLGGLAVAASVAAVVVVSSQLLDRTRTDSAGADLAANSVAAERSAALQRARMIPVQRVSQGDNIGVETQHAAAELRARRDLMRKQIDGYMQVHAQHASMNGSQGALPLARFANYQQ